MEMNLGQDNDGSLKPSGLDKVGTGGGQRGETPVTKAESKSAFDIAKYLADNMVKVDTENKNIVLEVLKYPVTQAFYHEYDKKKKFREDNPNFPADEIRWIEAIEFCNWLSERQGKQPCYTKKEEEETGYLYWSCDDSADGYRLPSLVDWFFVAREGISKSNFKFSGGSRIENVAWYGGNSKGKLHEVGKKASNKLGLYDLSGNIWEFCWDKYKFSSDRVACGGSAVSEEELCIVDTDSYEHFKDGVPNPFVGFRIFRYIKN